MSNIVTQLRNTCDSKNCWCPMTDEPCIYSEAAKEIERLRKELDIYKDLYAAEIVEKAMKK